MTTLYTGSFQKTVLASLIGLLFTQPTFALQEISDSALSEATGEGIALLPQEAYMVFQGEKSTTTDADLLNRSLDTGYINYIPVGPLTVTATDTGGFGDSSTLFNASGVLKSALPVTPPTLPDTSGRPDNQVNQYDRAVGKADIFLYGLAISKANNADPLSTNERVGVLKDGSNTTTGGTPTAINKISSWGTPSNPWLFKAETKNGIPTFTPDTFTGSTRNKNTDTGSVTYLALEAPLYEYVYDNTGALDQSPEVLTGGLTNDAYKLKLGLWADAFVRNPYVSENSNDRFNFGTTAGLLGTAPATTFDTTRANRLRLQGVFNNFSLNGSNLKIFQTLNGAGTTGGLSPFYNNTLGMSGVIRLNSGDSRTVKATYTPGSETRQYRKDSSSAWVNGTQDPVTKVWSSTEWKTPGTSTTAFGDGCGSASTDFSSENCLYRFRSRQVKDSMTGYTWTPPKPNEVSILRLSTKEANDDSGIATTPALSSTPLAPTFDNEEGIHIYNPNINLVLGNLYQPVIFGSDGKNFSLEIARIPNKQEIYSKIYTRYAGDTGDAGVTYSGSTCNVYQCGTTVEIGGRKYQGADATHSSITIGTVDYNAANNTLTANGGDEAIGISFGVLKDQSVTFTGSQGTVIRNEVQYQQRQQRTRNYTLTDRYTLRAGGDQGLVSSQTYEQVDPYGASTISCNTGWSFSGRSCSVESGRWQNITGQHDDWVYLYDIDSTTKEKKYQDYGTSFTIYCSVASSNCLAGTPKGATLNPDGTLTWQSGFGENSKGVVYTCSNGSGCGSLATIAGFVAGLEDCWGVGASRQTNCYTGTGNGIKGLSSATGDPTLDPVIAAQKEPTKDANKQWNSSLPWFDAATSSQISNVYQRGTGTGGLAGTGVNGIMPQTIPTGVSVGVNPSPKNNFGSASIDGLLIQHFKLTTKGL